MVGRFFNMMLSRYDENDYVLRQKARVLLVMYIVVFLAVVLVVSQNLQNMIFDVWVTIPLIGGLFLILVMIWLLSLGYYTFAAHSLIVFTIIDIWVTMYFEKGELVARLDTIAILIGILSVTALVASKHKQVIIFYYVFNIILLLAFIPFMRTRLGMTSDQIAEYMGDSIGGIIIACMLSYQFFSIYTSALARANDEIEKNSELNRTLEQKVEVRTSELQTAMEEIEAMNDYLNETNRSLLDAQHIMHRDMDMAVNVQRKFLPGGPPQVDGWEIAYHFRPMSGVSGDFYDFYVNDRRLDGLAMFDVSGHGIASGLITMITKSILYRNFSRYPEKHINEVLSIANQEIIEEIGQVDNYISGIFLRFDGGQVEYANAGHIDMLKYSVGNCVTPVLPPDVESKGLYLGVDMMNFPYPQFRFSITPGDELLLFTDGLVEGRNTDQEQYGMQRVMDVFTGLDPKESCENRLYFLVRNFLEFTGNNVGDDLTVILLRKK
jgi:sigma-B regulation protein RsbU (phosphoserine phosphatase)